MNAFPLLIFSVDREIFAGEAKSVTVPAAKGEMQVLAGHTPLISKLGEGNVIVESAEGKEEKLPIASGVIDVREDQTVVLVNF